MVLLLVIVFIALYMRLCACERVRLEEEIRSVVCLYPLYLLCVSLLACVRALAGAFEVRRKGLSVAWYLLRGINGNGIRHNDVHVGHRYSRDVTHHEGPLVSVLCMHHCSLLHQYLIFAFIFIVWSK